MDIGWSTQYGTHHKNIQLIALQMWSPSIAIDMVLLVLVLVLFFLLLAIMQLLDYYKQFNFFFFCPFTIFAHKTAIKCFPRQVNRDA